MAINGIPNAPEFPEPGGRLRGEPSRAWAAFRKYRDTPPESRSVRSICPATNRRQWETWCADWGWPTRAAEWDDARDRAMRVAELRAAQEMGTRHAEAATALIAKGIAALKTLKISEMGTGEILKFIVEGARLERLARGEPENAGVFSTALVDPQETIRGIMESDPEVARAAARFSAQMLRAERERQEEAERRDE